MTCNITLINSSNQAGDVIKLAINDSRIVTLERGEKVVVGVNNTYLTKIYATGESDGPYVDHPAITVEGQP